MTPLPHEFPEPAPSPLVGRRWGDLTNDERRANWRRLTLCDHTDRLFALAECAGCRGWRIVAVRPDEAACLHCGAVGPAEGECAVRLRTRVAYLEAGLGALNRATKAAGVCLVRCASSRNPDDDCDCGYVAATMDEPGDYAADLLAGTVDLSGAIAPDNDKENT